MPADALCKIVHQYNKYPIPRDDMEKLLEIADDYSRVKNYVYEHYGGISSLCKIYPGYTIQNEMTQTGLRGQLGLPSVYFYLAIFDALGDIKTQWTKTKSKVASLVGRNESFTSADRHYLRFILKSSNAFEAILNQKAVELPKDMQILYEEIASLVDTEKLNRYLCRQVRKHYTKQHTNITSGFFLSERAYRYGNHGIYISIKEKRKRVFIALTDNNQYIRQIYIKLYPEQNRIEINVPINVAIKYHEDYVNIIGVSMGIYTMLTTHNGNQYGKELGKYQIEYANWMRIQTGIYNRNRKNNPGRKKYEDKKRRLTEQLHSYINHELNYFLQTEKPHTIYMIKMSGPGIKHANPQINNIMSMWQRGYIRKRLEQKCKEQSIKLVEVPGKDISNECSFCGKIGIKQKGIFTCPFCGYSEEEKTNTARNVKKRGTQVEDYQNIL
ncbi:MAG: transposase [Hungatella sp.]|nr:transposase [Hungatella sp.]